MDDPTKSRSSHPLGQPDTPEALPESLQRDLDGLFLPVEPIAVPGDIDARLSSMARAHFTHAAAGRVGAQRPLLSRPASMPRRGSSMRMIGLSLTAAAVLAVAFIAPRLLVPTARTSSTPSGGLAANAPRHDADGDGRVDIVDAMLVTQRSLPGQHSPATRHEIIASMAITTLVGMTAQPDTPAQPITKFVDVDVIIDSGDAPLAAYQVEFSGAVPSGRVELVGVEGIGADGAFTEPPAYDPAALQNSRVILADFSELPAPRLPHGNVRVARVHLMIQAPSEAAAGLVEYTASLVAAGGADGVHIKATASVEQGERR